MPKIHLPQIFLITSCIAMFFAGCRQQLTVPPQPPPPVVTVTRPVMHPVQTYYEYNGSLDAVERVEITARVMGFLNEIAFQEGDEVEKGDLLFRIDPREYNAALKRAQADQRKAVAELRHAELEEKRGKLLLESAAISEEDAQSRIVARETAQAVLMQTDAMVEAAQLQFAYTEIRSPIRGQISRTYVTPGNLVGQAGNTLLTTILSMDPLYVYFDAPERDLIEYQRELSGGAAPDWTSRALPVEIGVATEEGYPHSGTIDFRENRVDEGTGTVRIRGRIPNPRVSRDGFAAAAPQSDKGTQVKSSTEDAPQTSPPPDEQQPAPGDSEAGSEKPSSKPDAEPSNQDPSSQSKAAGNSGGDSAGKARLLYPGLFARVRVPKGTPRMLAAIPEDALMTGQEGRFVYVVGEGNVIEKRTVTLGPTIWKVTSAAATASPAWKLIRAGGEPPPAAAGAEPQGAPGGGTAEAPTPTVFSVVSIESGLTPEDQIIINGLIKSRPGFPVSPDAWELKAPEKTPSNE